MGPRPRMSLIAALFTLAFDGAKTAKSATFSPPASYNGGTRSGAAALKRAARKRRNVRARASK